MKTKDEIIDDLVGENLRLHTMLYMLNQLYDDLEKKYAEASRDLKLYEKGEKFKRVVKL